MNFPPVEILALKNLPNYNTEASRKKSGPLVLDDMKISYYVSDPNEFHIEMVLSIIRMATWLQKNILVPYPDKGYYLRNKLSRGIRFTEEMNTYLIDSYRHWTNEIKNLRSYDHKNFVDQKEIDSTIDITINHCNDITCNKCVSVQQYLQQILSQ